VSQRWLAPSPSSSTLHATAIRSHARVLLRPGRCSCSSFCRLLTLLCPSRFFSARFPCKKFYPYRVRRTCVRFCLFFRAFCNPSLPLPHRLYGRQSSHLNPCCTSSPPRLQLCFLRTSCVASDPL